MSDIAIKIEHVSKQYRLGLVSTGTLSHDLNRWWATKVMHREDPYLKVGEVNDRTKKGTSEYVWALKDINMEIKQGDVVGIIGKNGAGKSTLLKLLSRVTTPTTGTISYKGRIASLLEVGTGFHPELTGRENIYMNGAIMGMSRAEITKKLDEIVDFSGCERYLDTPVKRYSSGMTVRLGFAIAAHIEPDILVVDEVLAVGDAEFQKKAIGKMQDVSKGEGRTVLFVSHNMASIRALCKRGFLLEKGMIKCVGEINEVVDNYLRKDKTIFSSVVKLTSAHRLGPVSKELEFIEASIKNDNERLATEEPLCFALKIQINNDAIKKFTIGIMIDNSEEQRVGSYVSSVYEVPKNKTMFIIHIILKDHNLARGIYYVGFNIGYKEIESGLRDYDVVHYVLSLNVVNVKANVPIVLWQKQWGNTNYRNAEIRIE